MLIIFLVFLGLSFGSFIGVLVDRLPKGKKIGFDRSRCDYCQKTLAPFDMIPVLSFFILNGKCRYCRKRLSFFYPVIEILSAVSILAVYFSLVSLDIYSIVNLIYFSFISLCLVGILFTDLKYYIIPDIYLISIFIASLFYRFFVFGVSDSSIYLEPLIAAFLMGGFFYFLYKITREKGMGFGDVKMALIMGWILGLKGALVSFYLAFLTGALISMILLLAGKKEMKEKIPFGPFLSFSFFTALLFTDYIWIIAVKFLYLK